MDCQLIFFLIVDFLLFCHAQETQLTSSNAEKIRRLPSLEVCGKSGSMFGQKIFNGQPVELGAYPWMANLGYIQQGSDVVKYCCAGSLITDQYVVTAAHCLVPALIRPFVLKHVRLGELDLNDAVADGATPTDFDIGKVIVHQDHHNTKKINDIGLLKLKTKAIYTALISPICLPLPEFNVNLSEGYLVTIAGWGRSLANTTRVTDSRLLEAEVEVQETESCKNNVTTKLRSVQIDNKVICASAPGKDSCQSDSGGPMMMFSKASTAPLSSPGNMFLMGVVSYGYRCAEEGYPGVYTRVSEYTDWIIENLDI